MAVDLQIFFTDGKSSKFPTKPILVYPPHLNYVSAVPRKRKNRNFALFMHVEHVLFDFLSSVQQISVKYHENTCKD